MSNDLSFIKPYGDTENDGAVQLSFTLPIPADEIGAEAARQLVEKMGFEDVSVVHRADVGEGFSFYVVYGHTKHHIDVSNIVVPKVESDVYSFAEVNRKIEAELGRRLVIVGACTGSDAHTVGIDAIMNMKGYNFHYGLERYPWIDALNMGSQIPNEVLLRKAIEKNADAVLVSQVVTAKESHIHNLTEFIELAESFGVRDRMQMIVGGPRINHQLALELGFDAGFGPGTYAEHVASFVLNELLKRIA
jgi:beta-lysine 5,6-aminomutase beta subunit